MESGPTLDVMRTAARVLQCGDVREKLHALQALQDAVDGAKSQLLVELDSTKDFELDGASTLNAWLRTQLRMNTRQASILIKNAAALRDLPLMADAAMAGQVSAAHVQVFAYGLKHVGLDPMREFEEVFVQVALEHEPAAVFEAVKHLKDTVHSGRSRCQVARGDGHRRLPGRPAARRLACDRVPQHPHRCEAEEDHRRHVGTPRRRRQTVRL